MTRDEIFSIIEEMIKPLNDRVNNMIRFGEVISIKDGKTQSIQVSSANNEVIDNAKYIETYGITGRPPKGSELVSVNIQGNAGNVIVINVGNREIRFKSLKNGEVAVYDDSGNVIHLQNGGKIEIDAPNSILHKTKNLEIESLATTINSPNINLGENLGQPVATVGCLVAINPATNRLEIMEGSSKVKAEL